MSQSIKAYICAVALSSMFINFAAADDMMTTYQLAVKQDPVYQAAVNTYKVEQARLGIARSTLLPFLDANASTARRGQKVTSADNVTGFDGEANYNVDDWAVSFNQTLFDIPAWQGYKKAKFNLERAGHDFHSAQQNLIFRVASIYGQALIAKENLRVSEAENQALAEQLQLDKERLKVGLGTVTNLYATESRYQLAVTNVVEADFALRDALQALRELTGQMPGDLRRIADDKPPLDPPEPDSMDFWLQTSLKNNLEYLSASSTVAVADREISRIKGQHLPTLGVVASRSYSDASSSLTGAGRKREGSNVGLRLVIPLIQGWGVVAGIDEARSQYQVSLQKQESARRNVDRTSRSSYQAVKSGISRLKALKSAVKAGKSTVEAKREGFKAGVNTNVEVLDAVRDLYGSERNYINAKYQFILSTLKLKQVAGKLVLADLERVNGWLGK
ncbi:MAG: TolC family outer membrane protein [Gammaproteobacteria bacterium]|nr:TolC family outer membrane protein [Gammaproteobacteria bacterium]